MAKDESEEWACKPCKDEGTPFGCPFCGVDSRVPDDE